jgi:Mannosyl-glycoprotein endo-beta-N-acetylglucosaminidase.
MTTKKIDAAVLYGCLIDAGFNSQTAKIITAQAAHETGNFTSILYKEFNNPFGMKHPAVRQTTATGTWYGYATFPDIVTAVADFVLYWKAQKLQSAFAKVETYITAIKARGYFGDLYSTYLTAVKHYYNQYYANS